MHAAEAKGVVDVAAVSDTAQAVSATPLVALRPVRSLGGTTGGPERAGKDPV